MAKVIPIYKNSGKEKVENYRPISILPIFSKILEKLVYKRLVNYLSKNNILYAKQFGFREKYSTSMALIEFTNLVTQALENKLIPLGVFLDLSKAFDCINHSVLLQKLYFYGIRGTPFEWFKNYLINRKQFVEFNHSSSEPQTISTGVPQGSVLGPLLFCYLLTIFILCLTSSHLYYLQMIQIYFCQGIQCNI